MMRPYKISPYEDMVSLGCPWIAEVKSRVLNRINEFYEFIATEAEHDGIPYFTDEDFLYQCFVENIKFNLVIDNLQVLKYFVLFFKVKILYDMIGEWKFTDRDIEMYTYFRDTDFGLNNALVSNKLKFNEEQPSFLVHDESSDWFVYFDDGTRREFYVNFFRQAYVILEDMVRNVKGLDRILTYNNTFEPRHKFHAIVVCGSRLDYSELRGRSVSSTHDFSSMRGVVIMDENKFRTNIVKSGVYNVINKNKTRQKNAAWRSKNPEYIKQYHSNYVSNNKPIIHAKSKRYREDNKDELKAKRKDRYERNRETILIKSKQYYRENAEYIKEYHKNYNKEHKAEKAEYNSRYRALNYDALKEYDSKRDKKKRAERARVAAETKKAAGYRYRKDPVTGKHKWIYVGNEKGK